MKRTVAAAVVLAAALTPSGAAIGSGNQPALTLPVILQRHAQAVGFHNGTPPQSLRISGTVRTGGLRGTWRSTYKRPDKQLNESSLGGLTNSSGFDGKTAWQCDGNGNVRLSTREELKRDGTNAEDGLRAGITASHITLQPLPDRRTGDYVLDLDPENGNPITVYLDPKTYLIARTEEAEDDETITTTYQEWQTQNGSVQPKRWTTGNGDKKYDSVVEVTGIESDVDVPDSLFAEPQPSHNYRFLKPGATSATVPFDFDGDKIALAVEVNGVPVHVALDSGAGGIVLSQALVDALKLKPEGVFEGKGIGGGHASQSVALYSLEIRDALQFTHLQAASGIALIGSLEHPLVALVGYDLLSRFVVRIDYASQQITFTEPEAFLPGPADGTPIPIELDGDSPSVEASFDGLPPARFLLDTGDPDTVQLSLPYVQANGLATHYPNDKGRTVTEHGIGGAADYEVYHAKSLALGGVTMNDLPAYFPHDNKGGSSREIAGIIGTQVLSRFVVTFDYPHQRLFLAPGGSATDPFDTRTFGIGAVSGVGKDGKLHVVIDHIDYACPALKNGLKVGDEIVAIDGQPVSSLGADEVARELTLGSEKTAHDLSLRSAKGKTYACHIALYDLVPNAP